MTKHDFTSLSVTLRHVADMLLKLASEIEAESDIHDEEIELLREQVGDTNLLVSALAEREAQAAQKLAADIEALKIRTERRAKPREEAV